MAPNRHLPVRVNPLMTEEVPPYEVLVDRRRLGQTDLAVKAGQVGTSNSTKPKNLGTFDYAHLRAPLPKGIMSGIFRPSPASYFLMRRSHDGFISATGMFKATFPYSEVAEEEMERKYIKSLPTTSTDETAGNVWIPPHHALELAQEYQILPWIKALLDNAPIDVNQAKDATPKSISPPPRFVFGEESTTTPTFSPESLAVPVLQDVAPALVPHESSVDPTPSGRGRPRRSASPSKASRIASPRKTGTARARKIKQDSVEPSAKAASKNLQQALNAAAAESEPSETKEEPVVRVNVDTDVVVEDGVETSHTHVDVEMPAGLPELPLPKDTEAMIAKAKKMVEAATRESNGESTSISKKLKRKAEEVEEEEVSKGSGSTEVAPAKKVKVESDLRRERVKTRALIGLSATLALGHDNTIDTTTVDQKSSAFIAEVVDNTTPSKDGEPRRTDVEEESQTIEECIRNTLRIKHAEAQISQGSRPPKGERIITSEQYRNASTGSSPGVDRNKGRKRTEDEAQIFGNHEELDDMDREILGITEYPRRSENVPNLTISSRGLKYPEVPSNRDSPETFNFEQELDEVYQGSEERSPQKSQRALRVYKEKRNSNSRQDSRKKTTRKKKPPRTLPVNELVLVSQKIEVSDVENNDVEPIELSDDPISQITSQLSELTTSGKISDQRKGESRKVLENLQRNTRRTPFGDIDVSKFRIPQPFPKFAELWTVVHSNPAYSDGFEGAEAQLTGIMMPIRRKVNRQGGYHGVARRIEESSKNTPFHSNPGSTCHSNSTKPIMPEKRSLPRSNKMEIIAAQELSMVYIKRRFDIEDEYEEYRCSAESDSEDSENGDLASEASYDASEDGRSEISATGEMEVDEEILIDGSISNDSEMAKLEPESEPTLDGYKHHPIKEDYLDVPSHLSRRVSVLDLQRMAKAADTELTQIEPTLGEIATEFQETRIEGKEMDDSWRSRNPLSSNTVMEVDVDIESCISRNSPTRALSLMDGFPGRKGGSQPLTIVKNKVDRLVGNGFQHNIQDLIEPGYTLILAPPSPNSRNPISCPS
ncbi:hypothetical protein B7494_g4121 [Chlorociboria aeruginascens]|nr:hypothetical protein B7494_g4121 [Chlorociboria aeruginascens]